MDKKVEELISVMEGLYASGAPSPEGRPTSTSPSIVKMTRDRLKLSTRTYYRRLQKALDDGWILPWEREREFTAPVLESPDMSEEELVDHVTRRFKQRRVASD